MKTCTMAAALHGLILCAALGVRGFPLPITPGYATFFSTETCPPGWEALGSALGRLVVSTAEPANSGVVVNDPLASEEDRKHKHSFESTYVLQAKKDSSFGGGTENASQHGTFPVRGVTVEGTSGYGFAQLPLCKYVGGTAINVSTPTLGYGSIGYYTTENQAPCPAKWTPKHDVSGRVLIPSFGQNGATTGPDAPLASGEDRLHTHGYTAAFDTSGTAATGIGFPDHVAAKQGQVNFTGTTSTASTQLPYVQLLTCINDNEDFATSMPSGAMVFFEQECPIGWEVVQHVNGRMLVGLPPWGIAGATFGGDPLASVKPTDPAHTHLLAGYVNTTAADAKISTWCCEGGFAKAGRYLYLAPSDKTTAGIPYTSVPMCQQSKDAAANKAFFVRARHRQQQQQHK